MFRIIHCFISNSGPCPIINENAAQADYIVTPKSQWLIVHVTCLWWAYRDFSTQSPQNSRLKEISISTIWNAQMATVPTAEEKYLVSQTPVFLYFCMKPTHALLPMVNWPELVTWSALHRGLVNVREQMEDLVSISISHINHEQI